MNHILAAGLLAGCAIAAPHAWGQGAVDEPYADAVRSIHPFMAWQHAARDWSTESGKPIATRENYETFIRVAVEEYKSAFSLSEIRRISDFYESPLGKRFLEHGQSSDLYGLFLLTIDPESIPELKPFLWICPEHPTMRVTKPAKCPICGRDLETKKLEDDLLIRRLHNLALADELNHRHDHDVFLMRASGILAQLEAKNYRQLRDIVSEIALPERVKQPFLDVEHEKHASFRDFVERALAYD